MMANLVEQVISTVFGKSGSEFINTMSRGITQNVDRFYDFVYVKVFGLPFVVLGARQTGKTTLIEWLRRNVHLLGEYQPSPTAPGGDSVGVFNANVGDEFMRLKPTRDVGGEYEMWDTDWVDLFRETRPRGVIFMIDHTDMLKHKDALNFVMNLIEEDPDARTNLRSFLLLVNKSDLWTPTTTLDKLMGGYSNEIKRLRNQSERLGYKSLIQSCSITNGVGVDDAMQTFFNQIRPQPKRTTAR
ncbi:MAG: ADP-ribosylation factor-like protein [Chloroflexota bacterium]|nr:ADP-ribosylation factor-like protein [Chloroflexota bacterium]